jgi:hypothetical protein
VTLTCAISVNNDYQMYYELIKVLGYNIFVMRLYDCLVIFRYFLFAQTFLRLM